MTNTASRGGRWTLMADPDGNEFRVLRPLALADADRPGSEGF